MMGPWRIVARWLAAGWLAINVALLTLVSVRVPFILDDDPFVPIAAASAMGLIILNFCALVATPVVALVLRAWVAIVRRYPAIDASWPAMLSSSVLLVALTTSLLAVLSNWQALLVPDAPPSMAVGFVEAVRTIAPWLGIGLLVPRLVMRSLRPNATSARSSSRNAA
jgi:hypothetical protein